MDQLINCRGFQWDSGNADKNQLKHQVSQAEAEQVFFNEPLIVREDPKHSQVEPRYYALGQTSVGRQLFIVFTIRENLIRVISARDMKRRERKVYQDAKANPSV
jgi:hypothetical protein